MMIVRAVDNSLTKAMGISHALHSYFMLIGLGVLCHISYSVNYSNVSFSGLITKGRES